MAENTCRICRCEATPDDPLFYPCKCRGSIKYIHQDCLIKWLNLSQRAPKCDICNTQYKFTTVYEENTPDKVPPLLILKKTFQLVFSFLTSILIIFNAIVFLLLQIPLFFKLFSRVLTWIADNRLPYADSVVRSLMFGDYFLLPERQKENFNASTPLDLSKFLLLFRLTFVDGITYLLGVALIHLILFLVHELVVRDEGYEKLVNKKFGSPNVKLLNLLRVRRANEQLAQNWGLLQRGQEGNNEQDGNHEDAQARENILRHNMLDEGLMNINAPFPLPPLAAFPEFRNFPVEPQNQPPPDEAELDFNNVNDVGAAQNQEDFNEEDPDQDNDQNEQLRRVGEALAGNRPQEELNNPNLRRAVNDLERQIDQLQVRLAAENEINRNNNVDNDNNAEEAQNNAENDNNRNMLRIERDNFQLQIDIGMSVLFPVKAACVVDPFLALWLLVFYLVPLRTGSGIFVQLGTFFKYIFYKSGLIEWVPEKLGFNSPVFQKYSAIVINYFLYENNFASKVVLNILNIFLQVIIKPTTDLLQNLANSRYPPTFLERLVALSVSYIPAAMAIYYLMKHYERQKGYLTPLTGYRRSLAVFIFEWFSTLKVFFIFLLELVIFPIGCGFLGDFVIAPLILSKFDLTLVNPFDKNSTITENVVRFFASNELDTLEHSFFPIPFRVVYYWLLGTSYMCFLSLFVGMTRTHILRPGVLYFIRSPDDQNARLLHDALVKPLGLQLSRIALSGLIYSIFIVVCAGAVTYSIRFLVPLLLVDSATKKPIQILPIRFLYNVSSFLLINPVLWKATLELQLITKYVRAYWKQAFRIACYNLRLSSFILDIDNPKERGHFLYRNFFYKLFSKEVPDYSRPQALSTVSTYFAENPTVNVAFIPDGNFVRAPDHDATSRKVLRELFVPVTKDDVLLAPISGTKPVKSDYESESEDEELSPKSHTVVYRPPDFKYRIFGLLLYLWAFSAILILSVSLLALVFGRPITILLLCRNSSSFFVKLFTLGDSGGYCVTSFEADWPSFIFGSFILIYVLVYYDKYAEKKKAASKVDNESEDDEELDQLEGEIDNEVELEEDGQEMNIGTQEERGSNHEHDDDYEDEDDSDFVPVPDFIDSDHEDDFEFEDDGEGSDEELDDDIHEIQVEIRDDQPQNALVGLARAIAGPAQRALRFATSVLKFVLSFVAVNILTAFFFFFVHILCVDMPFAYATGRLDVDKWDSFHNNLSYVMELNFKTMSIHLLVSAFTILPFVYRVLKTLKTVITNGLAETLSHQRLLDHFFFPIYDDLRRFYAPIFICVITFDTLVKWYFSDNFSFVQEFSPVAPKFFLNSIIRINDNLTFNFATLCSVTFPLGLVISFTLKALASLGDYLDTMNEIVKDEIYGKSQRLENMEVDAE